MPPPRAPPAPAPPGCRLKKHHPLRSISLKERKIHVQVGLVAFSCRTKRGCSRPRLVPPLYSPFLTLNPSTGSGRLECFFLARLFFSVPWQGGDAGGFSFPGGLKTVLHVCAWQNKLKKWTERQGKCQLFAALKCHQYWGEEGSSSSSASNTELRGGEARTRNSLMPFGIHGPQYPNAERKALISL